MKCLVTGAAGFIGSHLCERLLQDRHSVVGIDAFIPYYPRHFKEANLVNLIGRQGFAFHEVDFRTQPVDAVLEGVDVVFHLAAMAGLIKSWTDFDLYESCNVVGTQRLLEAVRRSGKIQRFVYVSTSSVYGRFASGDESLPTRPSSPYGVTKLAGEHLCHAFAEFGLPVNVLRYFSIYGPRQRPDMGYYCFIEALLKGEAITVFGDGLQARGNTYIDDCVAATVAILQAPAGETYNVGGGESANVWEILARLEKIIGRKPIIKRSAARPGDQRSTFADTSKLLRHVGWKPKVSLDDGLARQVEWQQSMPTK